MRTLVPLEAMGKLEKFSGVFDLQVYRKHAYGAKRKMVAEYEESNYNTDNVDYARVHHLPMPSRGMAVFREKILGGALMFAKHQARAILGEETYTKLKQKIKG